MDKRFAVTALAVLVVAAGGVALAIREKSAPEALPLSEMTSGVERAPAAAEQGAPPRGEAWPYLIREYEGRVAVFTREEPDVPEIVYDTLVRYLPDTDREELRQGIPVRDYGELVSRVEDYIS